MSSGSPEYQTLVSWIAAVCKAIQRCSATYQHRRVPSANCDVAAWFGTTTIVLARYNDGSTRDVSDWKFSICMSPAYATQGKYQPRHLGVVYHGPVRPIHRRTIAFRKAFPELDLILPIISTNWLPSGGAICMSNHRPFVTMVPLWLRLFGYHWTVTNLGTVRISR